MNDLRSFIDSPWLVKIELTKGCNLRCKFCPVYSDERFQGAKEYMNTETADDIGHQLSQWTPQIRVEFTMRGEPTLHPNAASILEVLRKHLPKSQFSMFTNGTGWINEETLPERLFIAGLNIFNVDCYNNTYERFKKKADAVVSLNDNIELSDFRQLNAYARIPQGHRRKIINLVPDIADPARLVRVRDIHNVAGNLSREQERLFNLPWVIEPLAKNCARPFRELTITCDGHILICCMDWNEDKIFGHVTEGIEKIWYGPEHYGVLVALYKKKRSMKPCDRCSYKGGYRLGFLRNPITGWSYRDQ